MLRFNGVTHMLWTTNLFLQRTAHDTKDLEAFNAMGILGVINKKYFKTRICWIASPMTYWEKHLKPHLSGSRLASAELSHCCFPLLFLLGGRGPLSCSNFRWNGEEQPLRWPNHQSHLDLLGRTSAQFVCLHTSHIPVYEKKYQYFMYIDFHT